MTGKIGGFGLIPPYFFPVIIFPSKVGQNRHFFPAIIIPSNVISNLETETSRQRVIAIKVKLSIEEIRKYRNNE